MAYQTTSKVRHSGKQFEKGDDFPVTGVDKKDIERLVNLGAIVDPEAEEKKLKKAEAEAKKQKEETGE